MAALQYNVLRSPLDAGWLNSFGYKYVADIDIDIGIDQVLAITFD